MWRLVITAAVLVACARNVPPGSVCDGNGNCNRHEMGCVRCAYEGVCKSQYDACHADAGCNAFIACVEGCNGLEGSAGKRCALKCEDDHRAAYEAFYRPMAKCAFCQACRSDCQLPPDASLCR
jgi:hypothetical protein